MARIRPTDLQVTDEERRLAREQADAASYGDTGRAIGGLAGGALGALGLLVPGAGAVTVPLGAAVGQGVGGAIGEKVGGDKIESASRRLADIDEERKRRLASVQLRQQALDALEGLS